MPRPTSPCTALDVLHHHAARYINPALWDVGLDDSETNGIVKPMMCCLALRTRGSSLSSCVHTTIVLLLFACRDVHTYHADMVGLIRLSATLYHQTRLDKESDSFIQTQLYVTSCVEYLALAWTGCQQCSPYNNTIALQGCLTILHVP